MSSPTDSKSSPELSQDPNHNQQEDPPQSNDPQSPKTLTLEIPDLEHPNLHADELKQDDPEDITPISPTISDTHFNSTSVVANFTASRRGGGGSKRSKRHHHQEKKIQKRLEILVGTFNPVPFVPVKTLDFASHEALLRRLGLWDFVHLLFDITFAPILLYTIKEGHFEKVDWAKLIWLMLEKELAAAPKLGNCYYASHLQKLIKHQKSDLFKEEPVKMEVDVNDDSEEEDVRMSEEVRGGSELEEHNIELSLGGLDNSAKDDGGKEGKEQVGDEDTMDFEESKEDEEQRQWLKSSVEGHFLRQSMEAAQIPFSSGVQIRDNVSQGTFLHLGLNTDNSWMAYEAKEQAYHDISMNQQVLLSELQRRDNVIQHLHKTRIEEQQKGHSEVYRLERELYMMGNLLEGYRKALKETHKAFAEYRVKCPLPEEPIYKDTGSGGLVLSTMELEKRRLKQEEEERQSRLLIEKKVKEFEVECITKFEAYKDGVELLVSKLMEVEKEVNVLKEIFAKRKLAKMSECPPAEE
ncbi:hypothetical protein GH714_031373 [Hevea brasiliensis]|uniref:Uncharacterized protein n=1 Tax=Hevea brasiliensis TaxID=3981 RepID=A0A6A6L3R2_HEVBR|nr:hypothetical protein GH714_031373 [Hevea brasiliensis]